MNLKLLSLRGLVACAAWACAVPPAVGSIAAREAEIAAALAERPCAPGRPIDDRAAWERLAGVPSVRELAAKARADLREPVPELPRELFDRCRASGEREPYERPYRRRTERLSHFAIAECLENEGRFLPAIETELAAILAEHTWLLPTHRVEAIDLASSARAATLAVADAWLGARLRPETRAAIRREVRARVLEPYLAGARSDPPAASVRWANWTSNWNAVCHAGVVGSALILLEDRAERAAFVAAAEHWLPRYFSGFTADGYCSEGIGYWIYGFGSYLYLAETVRTATGGRVDWLRDGPNAGLIRKVATYPTRLEIFDQLYPVYADASPGTVQPGWTRDLLQRRLDLGRPGWLLPEPAGIPLYHPLGATLLGAATVMFLDRAPEPAGVGQTDAGPGAPLRDEFTEGQVFVLRPAPGDPRFGVSFKGGHNDELHNHNDVGSFVVAAGGHVLLVDPGMEVYTARTFSERRYESEVINSRGHAVPVVGGKPQATGRRFAAKVLARSYSDNQDAVTLDLKAAYDVPALEALTRAFVFTRGRSPSFVVKDEARFSTPESFGMALITFAQVERRGPDRLLFHEGKSAVEAVVDTGGAAFTLTDELLDENLPAGRKARRIGITLDAPAAGHAVTVTIRPAGPPDGARIASDPGRSEREPLLP